MKSPAFEVQEYEVDRLLSRVEWVLLLVSLVPLSVALLLLLYSKPYLKYSCPDASTAVQTRPDGVASLLHTKYVGFVRRST